MRPGVVLGALISFPASFAMTLTITRDPFTALWVATATTTVAAFLVNLGGR